MKILAIETSCDETCAAVTVGTQILSNVVWSQVDLHKEFGGVVPSLARRAHEEKIDWVINRAMLNAKCLKGDVDAVAVTVGPGLAIALEVGIKYAKELAEKWNKPLIAINHIEGHLVSALADTNPKSQVPNPNFPCMGLVVSGGHTELICIEEIGKYKIVARTLDDALGESLDKAARMLGLGYPGGAELEKQARNGNPKAYPLPLPMAGKDNQNAFSYSGLKSAFYRLINAQSSTLNAQEICDLAACYQTRAFEHLLRVTRKVLSAQNSVLKVGDLLMGGGVAINVKLREDIKRLCDEVGIIAHFPEKGLYGDNAAMIGIAAGFKAQRGEFAGLDKVDRLPRWRIDQPQ